MDIIKIDNLCKIKQPSVQDKIVKAIVEDRVIILPAGTIYGLSCSYNNKNAIEKIYKIKKRKKSLPFIILISGIDDLKLLASEINPTAEKLINKFWDIKNIEPLTLIFNREKHLKEFITDGKSTIAIRMAENEFLRSIIDACGPIISTSATISGIKKYPVKPGDIPDLIKKQADMIVEYGFSLPGVESTIIDVTAAEPVLIRQGGVRFSDILKYLESMKNK